MDAAVPYSVAFTLMVICSPLFTEVRDMDLSAPKTGSGISMPITSMEESPSTAASSLSKLWTVPENSCGAGGLRGGNGVGEGCLVADDNEADGLPIGGGGLLGGTYEGEAIGQGFLDLAGAAEAGDRNFDLQLGAGVYRFTSEGPGRAVLACIHGIRQQQRQASDPDNCEDSQQHQRFLDQVLTPYFLLLCLHSSLLVPVLPEVEGEDGVDIVPGL